MDKAETIVPPSAAAIIDYRLSSKRARDYRPARARRWIATKGSQAYNTEWSLKGFLRDFTSYNVTGWHIDEAFKPGRDWLAFINTMFAFEEAPLSLSSDLTQMALVA